MGLRASTKRGVPPRPVTTRWLSSSPGAVGISNLSPEPEQREQRRLPPRWQRKGRPVSVSAERQRAIRRRTRSGWQRMSTCGRARCSGYHRLIARSERQTQQASRETWME